MSLIYGLFAEQSANTNEFKSRMLHHQEPLNRRRFSGFIFAVDALWMHFVIKLECLKESPYYSDQKKKPPADAEGSFFPQGNFMVKADIVL